MLSAISPRNQMIVKDVLSAVAAARSPLVLTERTEHLRLVAATLPFLAANHLIAELISTQAHFEVAASRWF